MEENQKNSCPICKSAVLSHYLFVKDHFLTKEKFEILRCGGCGLGITRPQPPYNEVGKYYSSEKYISHKTSNKGLIDTLYRIGQKINFRTKYKSLGDNPEDLSVLDYGAGSGNFVKYLRSKNIKVEGVEPNKRARLNASINGIQLHGLEFIDNFPPQRFDRVTLWHVLEHIHSLDNSLSKLSLLLKPSGKIIIAVPNYQSKDAITYKDHWAGLDVPRHLWHFSVDSLQLLLGKHDFTLENIRPLKLDAYYISLLSERYRGGNLVRGLYNGFLSNLLADSKGGYSSNLFVFSHSN